MAFTTQELQAGFRIGDSLVEPLQNRITRGGAEARVEPRVMDVLVCLASRAGEVVSRDTLNGQVWGNVVVTEQAVTNCISELRHHLGDDRGAHRVIETIPKRGYRLAAPVEPVRAEPPAPAPESQAPRARRWGIAAALALVVAALLGAWWWRTSAPSISSVAVAPFENAAGDETLSYLGLALPDEIATLLTKSRDIAVRPLAYVAGTDPLAVARARGVDHLVTGRYYLDDERQLSLAIEAQHVAQERVVWRTRITGPSGDLLAIRRRIAESVASGLLPALGARAPVALSTPANAEAYRLYLHSLALPQHPKPTERAIEMLEQAVTLEPSFAPAWHALGQRYYAQGTWWEVTKLAREKSLAAHRRALEADPDHISSARYIVTRRAEAGDLAGAYRDARQLLEHFGAAADTHFAVGYVMRYGGMLDASQRHCELARDHDRHDPRLRSCGYAYLYAGELEHPLEFFELDEGAYFTLWAKVLYDLRRDDRASALALVQQAEPDATRALLIPCLGGATGAALDAPAAAFVEHWRRSDDPETHYALAAVLAYCNRPRDALPLVERGVDGGYCAFPALDLDPVWKNVRGDPEYQRIRAKAQACHDAFRRMVESYDAPA